MQRPCMKHYALRARTQGTSMYIQEAYCITMYELSCNLNNKLIVEADYEMRMQLQPHSEAHRLTLPCSDDRHSSENHELIGVHS